MPSEASTSYLGLVTKDNAQVHAGHNIYGNVTHNYPSQHEPAIIPDSSSSILIPPPRVELASAEDSVHKEFLSAARQGQGTIRLRYLLSRGANVDVKDNHGLTAIYYASFRGDNDNVRYLAESGANVNTDHRLLGTPIAVAAVRGHSGVVKTLLRYQADILRGSLWLGSALHCACFGGDTGIFEAMMLDVKQSSCLEQRQIVHLGILRAISATSLKSSQVGEMKIDKHDCPDRHIKCSPVFLAAERCHFDLLRLCRSEYHYDYLWVCTWEVAGEDGGVGSKGSSQFRTNASYNSSKSGRSYASKASTTSAWSSFGFPLAAREHIRSTLLMWAAAQLNITLIEHLLAAGAYIDEQDSAGRSILHYAASPSADAMFKDVRQCVKLLIKSGASMSTTQAGQQSSSATLSGSALNLVVSADHAALDPRVSRKWGSDIHRTCISSFLDPLSTENRSNLAQDALLHALSHHMCPEESIELLCKHAGKLGHTSVFGLKMRDTDTALDLEPFGMDKALNRALETRATASVISILLDYGASVNTEYNQLPLIAAIASGAPVAVVSLLLQHGADPNVRQHSRPQMTALEYARVRDRLDLVRLFKPEEKLPDGTSTHSAELVATDPARRGSRYSLVLDLADVLTVMDHAFETNELEDLAEVDELDDPNDYHDDMNTPELRDIDESQSSTRFSRAWLHGISALPLPRFRSDGKQN